MASALLHTTASQTTRVPTRHPNTNYRLFLIFFWVFQVANRRRPTYHSACLWAWGCLSVSSAVVETKAISCGTPRWLCSLDCSFCTLEHVVKPGRWVNPCMAILVKSWWKSIVYAMLSQLSLLHGVCIPGHLSRLANGDVDELMGSQAMVGELWVIVAAVVSVQVDHIEQTSIKHYLTSFSESMWFWLTLMSSILTHLSALKATGHILQPSLHHHPITFLTTTSVSRKPSSSNIRSSS